MKFLRWSAPVYLWTVILLYLTWWPKIEIPDIGGDYRDKIAHILAFGILAFLVARLGCKNEINQLQNAVKVSLLYCSLFSIFDEAMQGVIPGRVADVWDGSANILGVFLAVVFFRYVWFPIKRRRIN